MEYKRDGKIVVGVVLSIGFIISVSYIENVMIFFSDTQNEILINLFYVAMGFSTLYLGVLISLGLDYLTKFIQKKYDKFRNKRMSGSILYWAYKFNVSDTMDVLDTLLVNKKFNREKLDDAKRVETVKEIFCEELTKKEINNYCLVLDSIDYEHIFRTTMSASLVTIISVIGYKPLVSLSNSLVKYSGIKKVDYGILGFILYALLIVFCVIMILFVADRNNKKRKLFRMILEAIK